MLKEGRQEFEGIIPQLPETGSKGMLTMFANATGMYLALYRVTLRHGRALEETGKVIYDSAEYLIHHIPFFLSRMFAGPFTNACSQAIWQSKVAPDVQGKVFAVRRAIA
jgi:hypothetical protein